MHLTVIGKMFKTSDLDFWTAHGTLERVVEAWHSNCLLMDARVAKLVAPHALHKKALKEAQHVSDIIIALMKETAAHPEVILRIRLGLEADAELMDILADDVAQDQHTIAQYMPTVNLSILLLGRKATFFICAELTQPNSPVITDAMVTYAQISCCP